MEENKTHNLYKAIRASFEKFAADQYKRVKEESGTIGEIREKIRQIHLDASWDRASYGFDLIKALEAFEKKETDSALHALPVNSSDIS